MNRTRAIQHPLTRQRGLTLVETMIALTLGLMLLVAVVSLFVYTGRANRQNENTAGMQDQARFALAAISRDLSMAGYWGGLFKPPTDIGSLSNVTQANDCVGTVNGNSSTRLAQTFFRLDFQNNVASTSGTWNCIGDIVAKSDVLALHRVAGQETKSVTGTAADPSLPAYNFYLKTNGSEYALIRTDATGAVLPSTAAPALGDRRFHRYEARIYYLRSYANTPGDGIPTLCRKQLCSSGYQAGSTREGDSCGSGSAGTAGMYSECLAEGVEDFQIVWGLDGSNSKPTTVDRRRTAITGDDTPSQALTAQIWLLMRSPQGDLSYTDNNTYTVGDASKDAWTPSTYADATGTDEVKKMKHYRRRLYSTTVVLRNPDNS